jgi:hypothetical protein
MAARFSGHHLNDARSVSGQCGPAFWTTIEYLGQRGAVHPNPVIAIPSTITGTTEASRLGRLITI